LINICQSYSKNKSGTVFLTHSVVWPSCELKPLFNTSWKHKPKSLHTNVDILDYVYLTISNGRLFHTPCKRCVLTTRTERWKALQDSLLDMRWRHPVSISIATKVVDVSVVSITGEALRNCCQGC